MTSEIISARSAQMAITHVGQHEGAVHIVWGHGWGQSSAALLPLAESLGAFATSSLIDFPGFGTSPMPPLDWGTADYADAVAEWLRAMPPRRYIWVGHSFGGRVGVQLAARHPELVSGMILIASAGLPRRRSLAARIRIMLRVRAFKTAKLLFREGPTLDNWRRRLGSADYQAAGALRPILARVVSEDLTAQAKAVRCPTLLVYGSDDQDTPPEIGERLKALIPGSELVVMNGFDHHSVLSAGRHQLLRHILAFVEGIAR